MISNLDENEFILSQPSRIQARSIVELLFLRRPILNWIDIIYQVNHSSNFPVNPSNIQETLVQFFAGRVSIKLFEACSQGYKKSENSGIMN